MNKKLKKTFVLVATGAIAIVLVFLLTLMAILNAQALKKTQNETIETIYSYESQNIDSETPDIKLMPGEPIKDRFIIIEINGEEKEIIKNNFLDYLDEETITEYGDVIISSGNSGGVYKDFRYKLFENGDNEYLILLNISESQKMNTMLLELFGIISLVILILSFIVINIMSKYAIRPFIDNAEKQKRFITDASHELKTPVTSIITSTDVLMMDDKNNEWLNNIRNQSNHLTKLINDLVMLTRLDEQKTVEEAVDTNIADLTWEVLEPFIQRAKAEEKIFNISVADDLNFRIDVNYYTKVLSVLLDNAIKYSDDKGTIDLSVSINNKERLELKVYNTCNPLPIKNLNVLFDRFYRIDNSRNSKTGGSGIGLSIVKGLTDSHKDKIKVYTSNSEDITFEVIFK